MASTYEIPYPNEGPAQFLQWLVSFRSPIDMWNQNYRLVLIEIYSICSAIHLIYLAKHGDKQTRYRTLLCLISAMAMESGSLVVPSFRTWWYEHPMITFFGCRLPLYVPCTYICMFHLTFYVSKAARLPRIAESCLAGIITFLILFPADTFYAQHLLWQYHDSDPGYRDRFYGVPWSELIGFCYHPVAAILLSDFIYKEGSNKPPSWIRLIIFGILCSALHGILYSTLYHIIHVFCAADTGACGFISITLFGSVVWSYLHKRTPEERRGYNEAFNFQILTHFIIGFLAISIMAPISKPENVRVHGPHQPIGPCDVQQFVMTLIFIPVVRNRYICLNSPSGVGHWNFDCVSKEKMLSLQNKTTEWYTMCGKPYPNTADYSFLILANSIVAITMVYTILYTKPKFEINGDAVKIKNK